MMTSLDEPDQGFWGMLAVPERQTLRAAGSWTSYPPDAALLVEDDPTTFVIVIWSGLAKVCSHGQSTRQAILALRGSGDILGEMSTVTGSQRCATVTALGEVTGLQVDGNVFVEFLSRHPHASAVLHHVLASRLRDSDRGRIGAGTMSVGQRLAALLLQMGERFGVPTRHGTRLSLALSQKDLAAFIGASERAVAREIEGWRQRGIVASGRRLIIIKQVPVLRRIAGWNGTAS